MTYRETHADFYTEEMKELTTTELEKDGDDERRHFRFA